MFQYMRIPSLLASFDALSKFFWLLCVAVLVFIYPPLLNLVMFGTLLLCALVLGRVGLERVWRALWADLAGAVGVDCRWKPVRGFRVAIMVRPLLCLLRWSGIV